MGIVLQAEIIDEAEDELSVRITGPWTSYRGPLLAQLKRRCSKLGEMLAHEPVDHRERPPQIDARLKPLRRP